MREGELTAVRCQMQPLVEPVYRMQDVQPFPRRIKDAMSDDEYAKLVKQKSYLQHMHRRSLMNALWMMLFSGECIGSIEQVLSMRAMNVYQRSPYYNWAISALRLQISGMSGLL